MILNKLWSVDKKMPQSDTEEKGKPVEGQEIMTVNVLKKRKTTRILYSAVSYAISTALAIFLLFLLFAVVFELNICLTCFPGYPETINKEKYDLPKTSKHDDTNAKKFPDNSSDLGTVAIMHVVTNAETTIAIALKEEPIVARDKEIVTEKEFSTEYTQHDNVSQAEILNENLETVHTSRSTPHEITQLHQIIHDSPLKVKTHFHNNHEKGIPNENKTIYQEPFDYFPVFVVNLGEDSVKNIHPTDSKISSQFQNFPQEPDIAASNMDTRLTLRKHRRIILKKKNMLLSKVRNNTKTFKEHYLAKNSPSKHPRIQKIRIPTIHENFSSNNSKIPSSETAESKVILFKPLIKDTGFETNLEQENGGNGAYYQKQAELLNKSVIKSSLFDYDTFPSRSVKFNILIHHLLKTGSSLNTEPVNYDYHSIPSENTEPDNYDYDDGISSEIDSRSSDDNYHPIIQSFPETKIGRHKLEELKQIKSNFNRRLTPGKDPEFENESENPSQIEERMDEKSALPQYPTNTGKFRFKIRLNPNNDVKMGNKENNKKVSNLPRTKFFRNSPLEVTEEKF